MSRAPLLARIPLRFLNDRAERELPTPVLRDRAGRPADLWEARHAWVDLYDPALVPLLRDAEHYADAEGGPDQAPAGLRQAARALLSAVMAVAEGRR